MNNISYYLQGEVLIETVNTAKATKAEAEELRLILDEHIETGWRNIIVDLTNCTLVDSSFWGVMVITSKRLQQLGGRFITVVSENFGNELFKVSGILQVVSFYNTTSQALESFEDNSENDSSHRVFIHPLKYNREMSY